MANSDNSFATSLRLSPELKESLKQAAERSGRSLSAEMTARLERSVYDDQTAPHLSSPITRMIAGAIAQAELVRGSRWYEDPETADLCSDAVKGILGLFMPMSQARMNEIVARYEQSKDSSTSATASTISNETKSLISVEITQWGREFEPAVVAALREAYIDDGSRETVAIKSLLADSPLKTDPWMLHGNPFSASAKPAKSQNRKTK